MKSDSRAALHSYAMANSNGGNGMSDDPMSDDGAALRLAAKLGISIIFGANYVIADQEQVPMFNGSMQAVRYAICRAAGLPKASAERKC